VEYFAIFSYLLASVLHLLGYWNYLGYFCGILATWSILCYVRFNQIKSNFILNQLHGLFRLGSLHY